MDHLSAQPLDCQLLDIYQQIHISHTHPHLHANTHTHTHRRRRTLRHPVGPRCGKPTNTHTDTHWALVDICQLHTFFCQAFSNEGHEIDPCDLRQIDPFPPLNLFHCLGRCASRRRAHTWHRQIQFERKIYLPSLVGFFCSAVCVCVRVCVV